MNREDIKTLYRQPAKAFYLSAAVCFVLLTLLLFFSKNTFQGHYFQPKLLAVTHLAALGWGTMLIFGICTQSLSGIFKADSFNPKPFWIVLTFLLSGLSFLVYAFWKFLPGFLMQAGSLLLLTGIIIFSVMVFFGVKRSGGNSIQQEYITTAFIWLIVTAVLGVLMVFNLRFAFLPKDHLDFLRIHAHTGIGGWFLMLTIGLSINSELIVSQYSKALSLIYYLINISLLFFLADAYLSGINLKTYAILLIGFTGFAAYLILFLKGLKQKRAEAFSILSIILLMMALILVPFIIHYSLKGEPSAVRFTTLYGTLIFMGWITAQVFSLTFKNYLFSCNKAVKAIYVIVFILFCITFFPGLFLSYKPLQIFGLVCLLAVSFLYFSEILLACKKGVPGRRRKKDE